jgi:large subunit ribosomal protein L21
VAAESAATSPVSELPAATLKSVTAKPAAATDVSLIGGIGPKIKTQLAAAGITSLTQIAALSDKALAALDAKLGLKGRTAREEWIAQAQELLAGKAPRAKTDKARAKNH